MNGATMSHYLKIIATNLELGENDLVHWINQQKNSLLSAQHIDVSFNHVSNLGLKNLLGSLEQERIRSSALVQLNVSNNHITSQGFEYVVDFVKNNPSLQRISVQGNALSTIAALQVLCKILKEDMLCKSSLELFLIDHNVKISKHIICFDHVPASFIISCFESIKGLELKGVCISYLTDSFTKDEIAFIFQELAEMKYLESISFICCKLKDQDLEVGYKGLTGNGIEKLSLITLDFSHNLLTDGCLLTVEQFLRLTTDTLQSLCLDGNLFSSKLHLTIMPQVARNLNTFSALISSISTTITSPDSSVIVNPSFIEIITAAAEMVGGSSCLRAMHLSRHFYILEGVLYVRHFPLVTAETMGIFTLLIHQLPSLRGIVCNHCALSDEAMETFCEALLMHQETLALIELKYNDIGDDGLLALADVVKTCHQLKVVNITGNISQEGEGIRAVWSAALNYCRVFECFLANDLPYLLPAKIIARMMSDFLTARLPLTNVHDLRIGNCIIRRHSGMSSPLSASQQSTPVMSKSTATVTASAVSPWEVILKNVHFEDEDMRLFSVPFMRHGTILSISFIQCSMSDRCLDDLGRALSVNTSIRRLSFLQNQFAWSTTGISHLLKALETNRSLRWLVLDKAPVDLFVGNNREHIERADCMAGPNIQGEEEDVHPHVIYDDDDTKFTNTTDSYNYAAYQTPQTKFASPGEYSATGESGTHLFQSPFQRQLRPYRTDRSPLLTSYISSTQNINSSSLLPFSEAFLERYMSDRLPQVKKTVRRGTVYLERPSIPATNADTYVDGREKRKLLLLSPANDQDEVSFESPNVYKTLTWSQYRALQQFHHRHMRQNLRYATQKIKSMFQLAQVIQTPPNHIGKLIEIDGEDIQEENWFNVCVSDYTEEEFQELLALIYAASERIVMHYIRLTYVPVMYRYMLLPFFCKMLQHPHIASNLHTMLLGDFVIMQGDSLKIQDWDLSRSWNMPLSSTSTNCSEHEEIAQADKLNESEYAISDDEKSEPPQEVSRTPTASLSPARNAISTSSTPSSRARLTSPPKSPTRIMTATLEQEKEDVSAKNIIEQFTAILVSHPTRFRSLHVLATDTAGIPMTVAKELTAQLALTGILHIYLHIKEDELTIPAVFHLLCNLSPLIAALPPPSPARKTGSYHDISINHGIVSLRNQQFRIEHAFFCRSRPRLELPFTTNDNVSDGKNEVFSLSHRIKALSISEIQAIEDALLSMDVYVQDMVQVDSSHLVTSSSTNHESLYPTNIMSKQSFLWIDHFNRWLTQHHAQYFYDDANNSSVSSIDSSVSDKKLLFFPNTYIDNPRCKDPLNRIHRNLYWTCFLFDIQESDVLPLQHILHRRQEVTTLSLVNMRISDGILSKLLNENTNFSNTSDTEHGDTKCENSEAAHQEEAITARKENLVESPTSSISWLTHIHTLNLAHNSLTDTSLALLTSIFFSNSSKMNHHCLTHLNVSHNAAITIQGIQHLVSAINQLKYTPLSHLLLDHTVLREDFNQSNNASSSSITLLDYYPFYKDSNSVSSIHQQSKLKGLTTNGSNACNNGSSSNSKPVEIILVQMLIDLLLTHATLQQVSFADHIVFTDKKHLTIQTHAHLLRQETQGIALICASRPAISHVQLRHNHLQDDQIVDLSAAIQLLQGLEVFDISYNQLTNVGMSLLAETLLIYGNESCFRYTDFSYNHGSFIIPNIHQAIEHRIATMTHVPSATGRGMKRGLSCLRVIQFDYYIKSSVGITTNKRKSNAPKVKLYLRNYQTCLYEPYLLIQMQDFSPLELQRGMAPVSLPVEISGGDIVADLSQISLDSPSLRQQIEYFLLNAQKLYHQNQHNITTNIPMCTNSLIFDHTPLDASFFAIFPQYIDGIVSLSMQYTGIDDTKAMHLEYAFNRSSHNSSQSNGGSESKSNSPNSVSNKSSTVMSSKNATSSLHSLQLQGNLLTDIGAQALLACAAASNNPHLRILNFADNSLLRDSVTVDHLAKFVSKKRLPSMFFPSPPSETNGPTNQTLLLSLNLSRTLLSDASALLLARTIAHPHCLLEAIDVSFTPISPLTGMKLLQALNTNRHLLQFAMNGVLLPQEFHNATAATDGNMHHASETVSVTSMNTANTTSDNMLFTGSVRFNWKHCPLQSLSLRHCQCHPRIVHALLDCNSRSLLHLDLAHNQLPYVVLMMILLKLTSIFPHLAYLHLYQGVQLRLRTHDMAKNDHNVNENDERNNRVLHNSTDATPPHKDAGLSSSTYMYHSSIAEVDVSCTKEDIEMIALEVLQESSSLQKLILYPKQATKLLPKKTSLLLRRLYDDIDDSCTIFGASSHDENEDNLYRVDSYWQHYYEPVTQKLSIVIHDDHNHHDQNRRKQEEERINATIFHNAMLTSMVHDICLVILTNHSPHNANSSSSTNTNVSTTTTVNNSKSSRYSSQANNGGYQSPYPIFQLFLQSLFFNAVTTNHTSTTATSSAAAAAVVANSSVMTAAARRQFTFVFSVLYERDVLALLDTLRTSTMGGTAHAHAQAPKIRLLCAVFVPIVYVTPSTQQSTSNSYSRSSAMNQSYSANHNTNNANGTNSGNMAGMKRFSSLTGVNMNAHHNGSTTSNSTSKYSRNSLHNSNTSHTTAAAAAAHNSQSSMGNSGMFDALCLVKAIQVFSLQEIGPEEFTEETWRSLVYPTVYTTPPTTGHDFNTTCVDNDGDNHNHGDDDSSEDEAENNDDHLPNDSHDHSNTTKDENLPQGQLQVQLLLTHYTHSLVDGLMRLVRDRHAVTSHMTLSAITTTTGNNSTNYNTTHRKSNHKHPKTAKITQLFLTKRHEHYVQQVERPLCHSISEKLLSVLIPPQPITSSSHHRGDNDYSISTDHRHHTSTDGVDNHPMVRSFVLNFPPNTSSSFLPSSSTTSSTDSSSSSSSSSRLHNVTIEQSLQQDTRLLDLLAMVIRRNSTIRHLHLNGILNHHYVHYANSNSNITTNHSTTSVGSSSSGSGLTHKLLDYEAAFSSVVTATVQNETSQLQSIALSLGAHHHHHHHHDGNNSTNNNSSNSHNTTDNYSSISSSLENNVLCLHQHALLLAPYLPATVNDVLQVSVTPVTSPQNSPMGKQLLLHYNRNSSSDHETHAKDEDDGKQQQQQQKWKSNEEVLSIIRNAFVYSSAPSAATSSFAASSASASANMSTNNRRRSDDGATTITTTNVANIGNKRPLPVQQPAASTLELAKAALLRYQEKEREKEREAVAPIVAFETSEREGK